MSDLKRDIEDVRWALKAFEPEERKKCCYDALHLRHRPSSQHQVII